MHPLRDAIPRFARFVVHRFFRQIEVTGLEHLPPDGGGILVSWHPNGLIDPVLILAFFPRPLIFGARHGLFSWPVLGQLMNAAGAVPVYRSQDTRTMDPDDRRAANERSLDALAEQVAQGSWSALFPEGDSHDNPQPLALKSGAARFWFRARHLKGTPEKPPVIIPVGLHYDAKQAWRSNALIAFHPPITLPEGLLEVLPPDIEDTQPEVVRNRVQHLTAEIDRILREVVHATESWELHHLMHRMRKLVRAERAVRAGAHLDKPDIAERTMGFARVWSGYYLRLKSNPEQVAGLKARVAAYDGALRALDIEDHELDGSPNLVNPMKVLGLLVQSFVVFFVLPPVLVWGLLVNGPPALGLWALSKVASKRVKDEATVKVAFGILAFPLAWLVAGGLVVRSQMLALAMYPWLPTNPWLMGLAAVALSILGGVTSLRYLRAVRENLRSLRLRLTRAQARVAIARLKVERSELYDATMALLGAVDLPGAVAADGRVVRDGNPRGVMD